MSRIDGLPQQFVRYTVLGAVGTTAHYLALAALLAAGWLPTPATVVGAVLGAAINYRLNYRYTFRSRQSHGRAGSRYFVVAGVGWLLNGLLFHGLHAVADWPLWPAQIVTTALVLAWSFAANRWWTFGAEGHG